jgi:hypothetical protein
VVGATTLSAESVASSAEKKSPAVASGAPFNFGRVPSVGSQPLGTIPRTMRTIAPRQPQRQAKRASGAAGFFLVR